MQGDNTQLAPSKQLQTETTDTHRETTVVNTNGISEKQTQARDRNAQSTDVEQFQRDRHGQGPTSSQILARHSHTHTQRHTARHTQTVLQTQKQTPRWTDVMLKNEDL